MFLNYIRMYNLFNLHSVLGKLVFLTLIIIATHYHILFGVLIVLLYMSLNQYTIEGMENKDAKDLNKTFRSENCKDGKLMKDDKEVTPQQIKESFPNIKFNKTQCNPCDEDCEFEIVSSSEQLTVEENLKSQDSNAIPVDRNEAIKKKE